MKKPKRLTHIVVKKYDLHKYINHIDIPVFDSIVEGISMGRDRDGKVASPNYIVINTDEPYIEEIVEVLKKHGHWDGWNEEVE